MLLHRLFNFATKKKNLPATVNIDCFVSGIYKMLPHHEKIPYLDLDLLCLEKFKKLTMKTHIYCIRVFVSVKRKYIQLTLFSVTEWHLKHSSTLDWGLTVRAAFKLSLCWAGFHLIPPKQYSFSCDISLADYAHIKYAGVINAVNFKAYLTQVHQT